MPFSDTGRRLQAPRWAAPGRGQRTRECDRLSAACAYTLIMARIVSVNTNLAAEFRKLPREQGELIEDYGLEGDRHAGRPLRQVSILNVETLRDLERRGIPVVPGDLGENLTVEGLDVMALAEGTRLVIGDAELEITGDRPACNDMRQVHPDALRQMVGRSGKMTRVVKGGLVAPGDQIRVRAPVS